MSQSLQEPTIANVPADGGDPNAGLEYALAVDRRSIASPRNHDSIRKSDSRSRIISFHFERRSFSDIVTRVLDEMLEFVWEPKIVGRERKTESRMGCKSFRTK